MKKQTDKDNLNNYIKNIDQELLKRLLDSLLEEQLVKNNISTSVDAPEAKKKDN